MRICIVGCGQAAYLHGPDFKRLPAKEVLLVDKVITRAAEYSRYFSTHYPDCPEVSISETVPDDGRFDLGIICTLAGTHRELAEKFLRHGTPIFVEKPLALSWEDLDWFEEQERNGAWITVGFQMRWQPAVSEVIGLAKEKGIRHVQCWKFRSRAPEYYTQAERGRWATDGGVMCQQAVHCVDLLCALNPAEDPAYVAMHALKTRLADAMECEDTAHMTVYYPNPGGGGYTATVSGTTALADDGHAGFRVLTPLGVACANGWGFDDITEWPPDLEMPEVPHLSRLNMWTDILDCLTEGKPPPLPAKEAARSMRIVHAGYVSAYDEEGCPVPYGTKFERLR